MTAANSNPWDSAEAASLYDRVNVGGDDIPLYLELASQTGGPVLEIGCGTGRCLIPLIRAGYDTVGLDRSQAMLDVLREKLRTEPDEVAHRATPLLLDARSFAIPLRFAMAFIGKNALCHLTLKAEQESFLTNVFDHLRPGGWLVIDVFNPDARNLIKPRSVLYKDRSTTVREEVEDHDHAAQVLTMVTTIETSGSEGSRFTWPLRYFYRFELEHLLEKIGFDIVSVWGDYEKTEFGRATERLFIVARKQPDVETSVIEFMRAAVTERV